MSRDKKSVANTTLFDLNNDIKDEFYYKCKLKRFEIKNTLLKSIIHQLLNTIKLHTSNDELIEVLAELRELKEFNKDTDSNVTNKMDSTIKYLSKDFGLCPICGERLNLQKELEIHNELDIDDPNRIEYLTYLACDECGFTENN